MEFFDPDPPSASIARMTAVSLSELLRSGEISAVELVQVLLSRIEMIDRPTSEIALRAVLALCDDAVDQARRLDADRSSGLPLGTLHGLPVLVKDNIDVAGLPSTAGSAALLGCPPRTDADLVAAIRRAGAIILGSANLSEWANARSDMAPSGWSAVGGLTVNPWALDRSAGNSSAGSGAAVAAGLVPLAIGTETVGSITCPASVNGVVGLKPTVGTIPMRGVIPFSRSQDVAGPIGKTVQDTAMLFSAMTETSRRGGIAATETIVVVASNGGTDHDGTDLIYRQVPAWLEEAGFVVRQRELLEPTQDVFDDQRTILLAEVFDDLAEYLAGRDSPLSSLEDVVAFNIANSEVEMQFFGHENLVAAMQLGGRSSREYAPALIRGRSWSIEQCLGPALEGADCVVGAAWAPAWKNDLILGSYGGYCGHLFYATALSGWPIVTVPMGLVHELPVGVSIAGRPNSEETILAVAAAIEGHRSVAPGVPLVPAYAQSART